MYFVSFMQICTLYRSIMYDYYVIFESELISKRTRFIANSFQSELIKGDSSSQLNYYFTKEQTPTHTVTPQNLKYNYIIYYYNILYTWYCDDIVYIALSIETWFLIMCSQPLPALLLLITRASWYVQQTHHVAS